jgi:hypothetical protein
MQNFDGMKHAAADDTCRDAQQTTATWRTSCWVALMHASLRELALLPALSAPRQTQKSPRHHLRLPRNPCPECLQALMQTHQALHMQQLLLLVQGCAAAADPLLLPRLLPLPPPCLLLPLSLRPLLIL